MTAPPTPAARFPLADARFPLARVSNVALLAAVAFAFLALRRYATYHNETYDLAFYSRLVWGVRRDDLYQPITDSYFWGLHASPVLFGLARLLRWFPVVPLLLVVQAAAVAAAGIPLARIASRRVGHPLAADLTLLVYLLYPTVATVATYEFHPSSLALFPLALALDYADRRQVGRAAVALGLAVTCREDVALIAALMGLAIAFRREHRLVGLALFAAGVTYFAGYEFWLAPQHRPRFGAFNEHFAQLGGSPAGIVRAFATHPLGTLRALATPAKLLYVPRLLVPVAFLSLLAPRWLLPALVVFGINFLSAWPSAVQVNSHYASLAVPFILASAAHGLARLVGSARSHPQRYLAAGGLAVAAGTLFMQHRAGATPLSRRWDARVFRRDARSEALARMVAAIPPQALVAAPDYVLPHVAERTWFSRVPWRRVPDYAVLSVAHRDRFAGSQDLWRSAEEVLARNVLAGDELGLVTAAAGHLLLQRGVSPRAYARGRYVDFQPTDGVRAAHQELGASLTLAAWAVRPERAGSTVTLFLQARRRWPADLGLELGWGPMHPAGDREDPAGVASALPFDGLFSPAHVRVGEVARTEVFVPASPAALGAQGIYLGARRLDGSRLDARSAHWTLLPGSAAGL